MHIEIIDKLERCIETKQPVLDLNDSDLNDHDFEKQTSFGTLFRQCEHVTNIDLSGNHISEIKGLETFSRLRTLDLNNNQILELKGVEHLLHLEELHLQNNEIVEVKRLENLSYLKTLNLGNNQITEIIGLEKLIQLNTIILFGNKITEIKGLDNLSQLKELVLNDNQIAKIKGLENLLQLEFLDLGNNQIPHIECLEKLSQLVTLYLNNNKIEKVQKIENLTQLRALDISRNKIEDLRQLLPFFKKCITKFRIIFEDAEYPSFGEINLDGNPFTRPPISVLEAGSDAVVRFFESILEPKYEAKILIVGEPEAGKTSLMQKITKPGYKIPSIEESTLGIKVVKWRCRIGDFPEEVQLNIWDFGGQEMQYLTHQFFLSSDALYILLTSARKDYDNLDYWFNIISLLGKNESEQNSELMVVANERQMQEGQVNKTFDAIKYHELYPHLAFTFHQVNLATEANKDRRFNTLLHSIKEKIKELPVIGKSLPVKWGEARAKLAALHANYIFLNDYLALCASVGIDNSFAMDLSAYLHTIGEIVHFNTDNFIILNPKWAVDGVYGILKRDDIERNDGHFTRKQMNAIWREDYSPSEQNLLTELMTKDSFEVAYKLPEKRDEYIAPQLLSIVQPDYDWDRTEVLHFRYLYPFMPKGIITRLIVRMHEYIKYANRLGLVWRTGVYLEKMGCIARVKETRETDKGQQVIEIEILGDKGHQKFLLYDICRTIEGIHKDSFSKINFERQVPCNCEYCVAQSEPVFFDYSELREYVNEGIKEIRCKKKVKNQVKVKKLLQDTFEMNLTAFDKSSEEFTKVKGPFMTSDPFNIHTTEKKVFISYSHAQSKYFKIFKEDLQAYLKLPKIHFQIFEDFQIPIGTNWDDCLQGRLADCDILMLLVSQEFINSPYIREKEFGAGLNRLAQGEGIIIAPVYFAPCNFEDENDLSKLQFFKPTGADYDEEAKGTKFSYTDLVKFTEKDGTPIENSNRKQYMLDFVKKLRSLIL